MSKPAPRALSGRIAAYVLLGLVLVGACKGAQATITCQFTTYSVAFGNYDPSQATATDGSGTVGVNCRRNGSGNTSVTVTLLIGAGLYGTFATREMQINAGTQRLLYNLYRDSLRTVIWGDGTGSYGTGTLTINGITGISSKTGSFTIFGRIPALQNVPAGNYADNIRISITP